MWHSDLSVYMYGLQGESCCTDIHLRDISNINLMVYMYLKLINECAVMCPHVPPYSQYYVSNLRNVNMVNIVVYNHDNSN